MTTPAVAGSPPPSWMPYQNLLAYFLSRGHTSKDAWLKARQFARLAFHGQTIYPPRKRPTQALLGRVADLEITGPLRSLLRRERPAARTRLDHLLLAYAQTGYASEVALKEVYLDYGSIDGLPPLSELEIQTYAALFWDFLALPDLRPGLAYLGHAMPASEELAIYRGERGLREVRASCLVLRSLTRPDYGGEVTVQVGTAMEMIVRQIHEDIANPKGSDPKALHDKAMLLSRLSLTQDRLRRSQTTSAEDEGDMLGLDELLGTIAAGRERKQAIGNGVPWLRPEILIRGSE